MQFKIYEKNLQKYIDQFQLSQEQLLFVKSPEENVEMAKKDLKRIPMLVFNDSDDCVVFFTLHEHSEFEHLFGLNNSIYIRSFSTDHRFLRNGYAKKTLLELPDFLIEYFPHIDYITLLVDEPNSMAKQMYLDCGFQDGKLVPGERYPAYTMIKRIK